MKERVDSVDASLALPQTFIDEMAAHALEAAPDECCGVVGRFPDGGLTLFRATNEADAEERSYRFKIPGPELMHLFHAIEGAGGVMLAIYHSHTKTEARPSPTDLNFAWGLKGPDPWPYWVLITLQDDRPALRAWRIDEGATPEEVVPVEIGLQAGPEGPGTRRVRLVQRRTPYGKPQIVEVPLS